MKIKTVKLAPQKLGIETLCRLMDTCLPPEIEDERDMQRLIDKIWPALVCEQAVDAVVCRECGSMHADGSEEGEFIGWQGRCVKCDMEQP